MFTRRQFMKLLGAIPLALGLRWPVAEPKLKTISIWDQARKKFNIWRSGYAAAVSWELKRESRPIECPFGWWFEDSNGEKWKSVDEGETWHKIVCQDIGRVKYADS